MLLVSLLRKSTPAALLLLAACGSAPSPDINNVHGTVRIGVVQDHAYYPHALVEEFKQFNLKLTPTEGRQLETAVVARVEWDITAFDSRCDVVIAFRHTAQWYNYALAGDGELMNAIPNWWGLAQEDHPQIQDPPLMPNPSHLLDVFMTGKPAPKGRALTAWYVRGTFHPHDVDAVQAYLVYGCKANNRFVVAPIEISAEVG